MIQIVTFSLYAFPKYDGKIKKAIPQSWQQYVSSDELQNIGLLPSSVAVNWETYKELGQHSPGRPVFKPFQLENDLTKFRVSFTLLLPDIKNPIQSTPLCLMCVNELMSLQYDNVTHENVVCINIGYETKQEAVFAPYTQNNILEYTFILEFTCTAKVDAVYGQYDNTVPFFPDADCQELEQSESSDYVSTGKKNMVATPRGTVVSVSIGNPVNS